MTSHLFESVARTMAQSRSVGTYSDYPTILTALSARFANDHELRTHLLALIRQLPDDWREGLTDEEMLAVFARIGASQ